MFQLLAINHPDHRVKKHFLQCQTNLININTLMSFKGMPFNVQIKKEHFESGKK